MKQPSEAEFEAFVHKVEPGLRRALLAAYGFERGREAAAEALAWSWEHWSRVKRMKNPAAYLFRVGQSHTRTPMAPPTFVRSEWHDPLVEPGLGPALSE